MIHCPELAAGLLTPRPRRRSSRHRRRCACRTGADRGKDGRDVTDYQLAAWLALSAAREAGQAALLTDGSPTCGSQSVYDGSFRDGAAGAGVAADPLRPAGITVFSGRANPAVARPMAQKEQMMIQCKRAATRMAPARLSGAGRPSLAAGIKKRGAGL
ncbi:DUF523 domain-containing protein [Klebsiella pneumoniae]|nr:DUF523 domain-containing protein [Klebsiella pneumoniae]